MARPAQKKTKRKERTVDISGFTPEGILISACAVPRCRGGGELILNVLRCHLTY